MKRLTFAKFSGAGNDFVIINNIERRIPARLYVQYARILCQRRLSIGADGLLIIEPSTKSSCDFRMVYYNADGSRAAMCGNGARCIAMRAWELELCEDIARFETDTGIVTCEIKRGGRVKLKLPEPRDLRTDMLLTVGGTVYQVHCIITGVPHAVVFVDDLEKVDVVGLGRELRHHKAFAPDGANVNFVSVRNRSSLLVRTYERGVEDETLACGTGCTASAVIAAVREMVRPPVECITRGGESLHISFVLNDPDDMLSPVSQLHLEGRVQHTFDGEIALP